MRACEHTHVRGSGDVVRGSRLPDAAALKLHEDGERLNKRKLWSLFWMEPIQLKFTFENTNSFALREMQQNMSTLNFLVAERRWGKSHPLDSAFNKIVFQTVGFSQVY